MKYILFIAITWFGSPGTGGLTSIEFNDKEACITAMKTINQSEMKNTWVFCFPKGEWKL